MERFYISTLRDIGLTFFTYGAYYVLLMFFFILMIWFAHLATDKTGLKTHDRNLFIFLKNHRQKFLEALGFALVVYAISFYSLFVVTGDEYGVEERGNLVEIKEEQIVYQDTFSPNVYIHDNFVIDLKEEELYIVIKDKGDYEVRNIPLKHVEFRDSGEDEPHY